MAMRITDQMLRNRPRKRGTNARLVFWVPEKGRPYQHSLWVEEVAQTFGVSGSRQQSRKAAHFYPRSMQQGMIQVTGRERSQESAQFLANFIRKHHESMISRPGVRFSQNSNALGNRMLMWFIMPSEYISVKGWIPSFTRTNRGVFEVAPQYTFEFFVVFDRLSAGDPLISHYIRDFYSPKNMKPTTHEEVFKANLGSGD